MNLRPADAASAAGSPQDSALPEAMFFLDYAARPLQDFLRAFSTEERLNSPVNEQPRALADALKALACEV